MSEREDGFYWVRWNGEEYVAYWYSDESGWLIPGFAASIRPYEIKEEDIGPRVQRDSEVVRERDDLLADLKRIQTLTDYWKNLSDSRGSVSGRVDELIARIESQKSGVKG